LQTVGSVRDILVELRQLSLENANASSLKPTSVARNVAEKSDVNRSSELGLYFAHVSDAS